MDLCRQGTMFPPRCGSAPPRGIEVIDFTGCLGGAGAEGFGLDNCHFNEEGGTGGSARDWLATCWRATYIEQWDYADAADRMKIDLYQHRVNTIEALSAVPPISAWS